MTSIAITGACGRMGRRLVALARESGQFAIVAAIVRPDHANIATDAGECAGIGAIGLSLTCELQLSPNVLIDFTSPPAMRHWLTVCRDRGIAMLIGTTGLREDDHAAIERAAEDIAILQSPNMSLGVAVLKKLCADAAKMLGDGYDIEIIEAHHRFKKDAPSGTAAALADAILGATDRKQDALRFGRHGDSNARDPWEIGMHSLRMGDENGAHTVFFASLGERLELTHRATNRDTFVHGALRAATWLAEQKPGKYQMADVLGI